MCCSQREIQRSDLPQNDVTLIPTVNPPAERGQSFEIAKKNEVPRPRMVGRLTRAAFQVFTMEKTPVDNPTLIDIPNEITLAQLVTYFILPAGGDWDVSTVFYWCPEEVENEPDKTKRELLWTPQVIPIGFVLRVKANTLRDGSSKRRAKCIYGAVPMCFMIEQNSLVSDLKVKAINWMVQRGLGDDWTLDRPDSENVDFDYQYPVTKPHDDERFTIFLRQRPVDVRPSESWINVSDRIVRALGLPLGSLFRIYPVIGDLQDRDPDDGSYSITWEPNKQYWFDIVYDESRDRRDQAKEVRMVDAFNRVDTLVVPTAANMQEIVEIWRRVLEIPEEIQIEARSGNGIEIFWGFRSTAEMIPYTLRTQNVHGDSHIFPDPDNFKADQIGRILDVKVPPIPMCQVTSRERGGAILTFDGEVPSLALKLLKEHLFTWNLEGRMLVAPMPKLCWLPYDFNEIMRFGHSVNTDIPEWGDEAEFPPTPWRDRVTIRVKSQIPPFQPLAPLPADGELPSSSSAPGLPAAWTGPALGQAPPISPDAAALAGYNSPNSKESAVQEPEDPELLRLRGLSCSDEDIHKLISWTTRKDYQTLIGISLPIKNWVGDEYHEIQFWEDTIDQIQFDHTAVGAYDWLVNRFRSRAANQTLPMGMPDKFENLSVVMYRTGKAGYILFTLLDSFASSLRDQTVKIEVNDRGGYTSLGMGDRYTLMMSATELWTLTHNEWQICPKQAYETRADGTVCHDNGTAEEFHQFPLRRPIQGPVPDLTRPTPRGVRTHPFRAHRPQPERYPQSRGFRRPFQCHPSRRTRSAGRSS
jgi:hypothetical protein